MSRSKRGAWVSGVSVVIVAALGGAGPSFAQSSLRSRAGATPIAPAARPQGAPQQTRPGVGTHIGGSLRAPLNLSKLQEARARDPKACGIQEVAPGTWVRIDCRAYTASVKAVPRLSARKARFFSKNPPLWKGFAKMSVKGGLGGRGAAGGGATKNNGGKDRANGDRSGGGDIVRAEDFPGTVDHRVLNLEGPIRDQGPVGSCTAFALSSSLDNNAIRSGKMTNPSQGSSPSHIWSGYGYPQMGIAADANVGRTIATVGTFAQDNVDTCKLSDPSAEEDCGDYFLPRVKAATWKDDSVLVGKVNTANGAGAYKIAGFERLETQPPKVADLVQILASGSDLFVAFKIDGSAWSSGAIKKNNGVIPNWNTNMGGHAVTMSGYRETPQGRQYLIHNSWGSSWADKGYAWVNEEMVVKYMHYAYKVKTSDGVKRDDLTDDDCAPDELVDIGLGVCGLICPDDTRPNNGCKG